MNILYVVPYVPNRIRVRSFQLLNSMLRRGHQVTLATLWESDAEHGDLDALRADGLRLLAFPLTRGRVWRNLLDAGVRTLPLQARYSWQPTLAAALAHELAGGAVDVVHVEHLRGSEYGLAALDLRPRCDRPYPVIWDSVDCISHLFAQAARQSHSLKGRTMARVELARTRRRESWLVNQFDTTIVTSTTDRAALQTLGETASRGRSRATPPVEVVGNGVDLTYFVPGDKPPANMPPRLVFSGKMSYHANVTAAVHLVEEIMPQVWARHPDVELWIVGKDPAAAVTALATTDATWEDHTPLPPRAVVVTGTVADLRPYLQQATVAVAPLVYGAGIQNKVLEAMACGAPVVASSQATGALAAQPGRDLLAADSPGDFAAAVLTLLGDVALRTQVAAAGRAYVVRHHSWDAALAHLEELYRWARPVTTPLVPAPVARQELAGTV